MATAPTSLQIARLLDAQVLGLLQAGGRTVIVGGKEVLTDLTALDLEAARARISDLEREAAQRRRFQSSVAPPRRLPGMRRAFKMYVLRMLRNGTKRVIRGGRVCEVKLGAADLLVCRRWLAGQQRNSKATLDHSDAGRMLAIVNEQRRAEEAADAEAALDAEVADDA